MKLDTTSVNDVIPQVQKRNLEQLVFRFAQTYQDYGDTIANKAYVQPVDSTVRVCMERIGSGWTAAIQQLLFHGSSTLNGVQRRSLFCLVRSAAAVTQVLVLLVKALRNRIVAKTVPDTNSCRPYQQARTHV